LTALASAFDLLRQTRPLKVEGVVSAVRGLTVHVEGLPLPVGALVSIRSGERHTQAEIIGVTREHAIVMPLGQTDGIGSGDRVAGVQTSPTAGVGRRFLGRVVDGLGRPIDAGRPIHCEARRPLSPPPLSALSRGRITRALATGVRAIDSMTTLGRGQRMGIFAGPGVGKSTLMGTIARRTSAQVNVIALIGERGREVKDFIDHSLGPEGLARSVVVVATGDESPLMRVRAAKFACTLAENFRDHGLDVMLMMDSITRFAHAQRQIGLAVGEPPATRGYTPSVFAQMALLLERAGAVESGATSSGGSITGLYTILVEGDDMTEPVADAARGILDGHLILSRKLAQRGHFPAIDVLDSVSRVADQVTPDTHRQARLRIVRLMALYKGVEELVQIGAYARGSDPETDAAIELLPRINALLRQTGAEESTLEATQKQLSDLAIAANDTIARLSKSKGR
jgi:flagellum-specific ATP synthase